MKKSLLKGLRVLDFSRILVGAYSSMLLADLGAEVIKVEPPGGDETRKWGPPFRGEDSIYFLSVNRNKKSICIDIKKDEAKNICLDLISKSDVIIENFTYGKMSKFGLDYDSAKEKNSKIIYASVNSYGNKGPMKTTPSFDLIIQSYVGVMNITGSKDTDPFKVGFPMCDIMAGSHFYGAILAGLLHRNMTGEGQYINTSLLETNLFSMPTINSNFLNCQINSERRGNDHPTISPYTVFKMKSGDYFSIGVATDMQFKKLWMLLSLDKNLSYKDFETNKLRIEKRNKLKEIIQEAIYKIEDDIRLFDLLEKNNIPFSKINTTKDVLENNVQTEELNMIEEIVTEKYQNLKYIRNPITYSTIELEKMDSPPSLGENTKEIMINILNKKDVDIEKLFKNRVIF